MFEFITRYVLRKPFKFIANPRRLTFELIKLIQGSITDLAFITNFLLLHCCWDITWPRASRALGLISRDYVGIMPGLSNISPHDVILVLWAQLPPKAQVKT